MANIDAPTMLELPVPEGAAVVAECKIIQLRPVQREVNEGLVLLLEDLTERARNGEIVGMAAVYEMGETAIRQATSFPDGAPSLRVIGMLEVMQRELADRWREASE